LDKSPAWQLLRFLRESTLVAVADEMKAALSSVHASSNVRSGLSPSATHLVVGRRK
jgi:hypothetical protein